MTSNKARVRCPHCEEHLEAERLPQQRKYRNKFGLDVFECPECHQDFKFEPREYFLMRDGIEKGDISTGVAIQGASVDELLPSEKVAIDFDRGPRPKRFVPILTSLFTLLVSGLVFFGFEGWWRYLLAVPLLAFGWVSFKTAIFAADKEIHELTGDASMSEETKKRFGDRL